MKITGAIFPKQKTKDTQPDFSGSCEIDGEKKDIAIWKKTDRNGNPFYSFTIGDPFKKSETSVTTGESKSELPF